MVNKTKGTNANLTANSVTINGVAYPLTATISATNTGRLNAKNAYTVLSRTGLGYFLKAGNITIS